MTYQRLVDGRTVDLANSEIHDSRATLSLALQWIRGWQNKTPWVLGKFDSAEEILGSIARRIEDDRKWRDKRFMEIMGYTRQDSQ